MSRTSVRAGTKSNWRLKRVDNGKPMPYGPKAVRNFKRRSR